MEAGVEPPISPTVVVPIYEEGLIEEEEVSMPMTRDQWADFFVAAGALEGKDEGYYDRCVDAIHRHWAFLVFSKDISTLYRDTNIQSALSNLLEAWQKVPPLTDLIVARISEPRYKARDIGIIRNRLNEIQKKVEAEKKTIAKAQYISEQYTERTKRVESELEQLRKIESDAEAMSTSAIELERKLGYLNPQDAIQEAIDLQTRATNLQSSANQSLSSLVQKCTKEGQPPVCEAIPAAKKHADTAKRHIQEAQKKLESIKQSIRPPKRELLHIAPKPPEVPEPTQLILHEVSELIPRELPSIQPPAISIAVAPEVAPLPSVSLPQGVAPPIEMPSPPVTAPVPTFLVSLEDELRNAEIQQEDINIIMESLKDEEDMWDSFLMTVDILSDIRTIVDSIRDEKRKNEVMNVLYNALQQEEGTLKQVGQTLSQLFNPNENERKNAHAVALDLSLLKKNNIKKRAQATAKHRPRIVANALQGKWDNLKEEYFLSIVKHLINMEAEISDKMVQGLTRSVMEKTWETLLPPLGEYTGISMPKIVFGESDTIETAKKKLEEQKRLKEIAESILSETAV